MLRHLEAFISTIAQLLWSEHFCESLSWHCLEQLEQCFFAHQSNCSSEFVVEIKLLHCNTRSTKEEKPLFVCKMQFYCFILELMVHDHKQATGRQNFFGRWNLNSSKQLVKRNVVQFWEFNCKRPSQIWVCSASLKSWNQTKALALAWMLEVVLQTLPLHFYTKMCLQCERKQADTFKSLKSTISAVKFKWVKWQLFSSRLVVGLLLATKGWSK